MPYTNPDKKRAYQRVWTKRKKELRKKRLVEQFGGECTLCGYNKYHGALDFHHRDPSQKKFGLGKITRNWDDVVAEARKCDLVCANCHRELHASMF